MAHERSRAEPGGFGGFFEDEQAPWRPSLPPRPLTKSAAVPLPCATRWGGTHQWSWIAFGRNFRWYEPFFCFFTEELNVAGQSDLVAVFVGEVPSK